MKTQIRRNVMFFVARLCRAIIPALFLALSACGGGGDTGGGAAVCTWDSSTWDNCQFGS